MRSEPVSTDPKSAGISAPGAVPVAVVVFDTIIERIHQAVANASVEVGGKLLGRLYHRNKQLVIQAESYIDSGPRVDASPSHHIPDGDYQEDVFRVVERCDPDIDVIGSWHSHHTNGLGSLSGGDIKGYKENVNDDRYRSDYFLAILATGIRNAGPELNYYLFARHRSDHVELDGHFVEVVSRRHDAEELLAAAERIQVARLPDYRRGLHTHLTPKREQSIDLNLLRAQDHRWLKEQNFQQLETRIDRRTGVVLWRWEIHSSEIPLGIEYRHPGEISGSVPNEATLEARSGAKLLARERIALNDHRFEVIADLVRRWGSS